MTRGWEEDAATYSGFPEVGSFVGGITVRFCAVQCRKIYEGKVQYCLSNLIVLGAEVSIPGFL